FSRSNTRRGRASAARGLPLRAHGGRRSGEGVRDARVIALLYRAAVTATQGTHPSWPARQVQDVPRGSRVSTMSSCWTLSSSVTITGRPRPGTTATPTSSPAKGPDRVQRVPYRDDLELGSSLHFPSEDGAPDEARKSREPWKGVGLQMLN